MSVVKTKGYYEVTLHVGGAVTEEYECFEQSEIDELVGDFGESYNQGDFTEAEVHALWHSHYSWTDGYRGECSCAQYAQSHKPYAVFGGQDV